MCGIAGVITTKPEYKDIGKQIFRTLMVDNTTRGGDSTGVLAINREDNSYSLFKATKPANEFMFKRKFRKAEADIWIGHTRLATLGEVSERNAHPLQMKDLFMVHNGMIDNHKEKAQGYYEVDSEVLMPFIHDRDWKGLETVEGSINFIAWSPSQKAIFVGRHDNPLYMISDERTGILALSSKKDGLDWVAITFDIETPIEITNDKVSVLNMMGQLEESIEMKYNHRVYTYANTDKKPQYYNYQGWEDDDYDEYDRMMLEWQADKNKDFEFFQDPKLGRIKIMDNDSGEGWWFNVAENEWQYYDPFLRVSEPNPKSAIFPKPTVHMIDEEVLCELCKEEITDNEIFYSQGEFNRDLCYACAGEMYQLVNDATNGEDIRRKNSKMYDLLVEEGFI